MTDRNINSENNSSLDLTLSNVSSLDYSPSTTEQAYSIYYTGTQTFTGTFVAASQVLPTSLSWSSIVYGNSLFVAIASNTYYCATSNNGITWIKGTMPVVTSWTSVAWNGSIFCAISQTTIAATSSNGISWTQVTLPLTTRTGYSGKYTTIGYGNSSFYALTSTTAGSPDGLVQNFTIENTLATSSDGVHWTNNPSLTFIGSGAMVSVNWATCAWNGVLYCATLSQDNYTNNSNVIINYVVTSPDLHNWSLHPSTINFLPKKIINNGSMFCAVGASPGVYNSSDGFTWNYQTISGAPVTTNYFILNDIAWNNSVFCAVGYIDANPTTNNCIVTSPDGINWTIRQPSNTATLNLTSVTTNGSIFVAVAANSNQAVTINMSGSMVANILQYSDVITALGYTPVNKTGDTMTGMMVLSGNPVVSLGAATKQYVDSRVPSLTPAVITSALGYIPVNKAGDSLTGVLMLAANPTTSLGAATKQYVDSHIPTISPSTIVAALGFTPVNKAGDSMTGSLILNNNPIASFGAATKQYVDNSIATLSVTYNQVISALNYIPLNKAGDIMGGVLILSGDPTTSLGAATKEYVDSRIPSLTYSTIVSTLGYIPVNKAGDTMIGTLTLSGNPIASLGVATKQYVDSKLSSLTYASIVAALGYVPVNKAGDSMLGSLLLWRNPINPLESATKAYVDASVPTFSGVLSFNGRTGSILLTYVDVTNALSYTPVNKAGDTMNGSLLLSSDPVLPLQAATKEYVDSHSVPITYATIISSLGYVPVNKAGDTMNGTLTLFNDPVIPLGAATKRYVDNAFLSFTNVTSFNNRTGSVTLTLSDVITALTYTPVNRAGDTMTGFLTLSADPVLPLQAVTKEYVDGKIASLSIVSSFNGDVTGSGTGTIALTLVNSGVIPGTYNTVIVDAKGRVIAGTLAPAVFTKYTDTPIIASGSFSTYTLSSIFPNQSYDGRNCIVNVLVLDPLSTSPTYNSYISADSVSTIATNSSIIKIYNNYTSSLTFYITIVAV